MDKLDMESKNIVSGNIEKIKELFPNVITEDNGKEVINFEMLKQELSEVIIDEKKEKYQLTWPGKKQAIVNANSPINKTLRPLKVKSVNFNSTKNIYIEGDNLEALKLLQESYLNKIDVIYIDPPYNTGNDFIYNDDFSKSTRDELVESGRLDEKGNILISKDINNNSNGRFHSNWLSMMYSRLKLARNLLTEDGVIAISINKVEEANLTKICDEIFSENNFLGKIIWRKNKLVMKGDNTFKNVVEPVLFYGKNASKIKFEYLAHENTTSDFSVISSGYGIKEVIFKKGMIKFREENNYVSMGVYNNLELLDNLTIENFTNKNDVRIKAEFKWSQEKIYEKITSNAYILIKNIDTMTPRIYFDTNTSKPLDYIDEKYSVGTNESAKNELKMLDLENVFSYPKPTTLIDFILNIINKENATVLDFFSGSATTAHSVMKMNSNDGGNRKYIMVQLPEECDEKSLALKLGYKNICEIAEERIKRAGTKIKNESNSNIDTGFRVYRIDESNMKDVFYKPNEISQQSLFDYITNVKEDRTSEDLLTQVILDLGLTLDLSIEEKTLGNNKVYYVADNALVACFDDLIDINIIDIICECQPLKVVFKDSSFKTDKDKINLEERVKKISPETKISIL